LKVLLSVEGDLLGLDLSILDIDFVTAENDWDVFTHSDDISVPVGNVLVGHTRSNIEHDDCRISLNVVSISETTELLLSGSIPDVEADLSRRGVETKWVDFDSDCSNVLLFELSSDVSLDESGLSSTTISNENKLECGDLSLKK